MKYQIKYESEIYDKIFDSKEDVIKYLVSLGYFYHINDLYYDSCNNLARIVEVQGE